MTIPARDVGRAFAEHGLRLHHEIFENFVERGAHVHVSIGEWRSVMEHKQLPDPASTSGSADRVGVSSHTRSISGSRAARFAFIGNSVRGKLRVFL